MDVALAAGASGEDLRRLLQRFRVHTIDPFQTLQSVYYFRVSNSQSPLLDGAFLFQYLDLAMLHALMRSYSTTYLSLVST